MLRSRWSLRLVVVILIGTLGCKHKPTPQTQGWAANHDLPKVVSAPPIPLETPVETLRVPNSGFPCAVDDVLAAKCRRCHTLPARHNAPFSLLTWDDTRGMIGDRIRYLVMASVTQSGYMPYNIPANPPVERLTDEEKKAIADWVEAGAPKAACPPAPAASVSARRRGPKGTRL
jgi:uncharacterized membrane protein